MSLSRASEKDEFSKHTAGADDIKRMQHNVKLFLSSELGHSPKRNVKLLGREQRRDFHHNRTTPLGASGVFFSSISFSLASGRFNLLEASFQSE